VKASEVAFRAAEVMAEKGHCKHVLQDKQGRVCYVGALFAAITGSPELTNEWFDSPDRPCFRAVDGEVTDILLERGYDSGVYFNNDEAISGEDVILLLKEAGKRLEDAEADR
jgi:hypothetical protein